MTFGESVTTCFKKYAVFKGRASRSEFWFFCIFEVLVAVGVDFGGSIVSGFLPLHGADIVKWATRFVALCFLLPSFAAGARRLHDTNKSGWFMLMGLMPSIGLITGNPIWLFHIIPFCGGVILFGLLWEKGTEGANRFGAEPVEHSHSSGHSTWQTKRNEHTTSTGNKTADKNGRQHVDKTVISCPGCQKKLAVPSGKRLKVFCPHCRMQFEVGKRPTREIVGPAISIGIIIGWVVLLAVLIARDKSNNSTADLSQKPTPQMMSPPAPQHQQSAPAPIEDKTAALRQEAEQGDASAQYKLGTLYDQGSGVARDYQQAAIWYRKAAEQGHIYAQFNLGLMYVQGRGVPQDSKQAAHWFRKAAEQGNVNAQFSLGLAYQKGTGVPQDSKQAVNWFRKAAEQGYAKAQVNLGLAYHKGVGVSQDYRQAVNWFRKAAEQGDVIAQFYMGSSYQKGTGVTQNSHQAVHWYRKAAEQGYPPAQYNLGVSYQQGKGVPQNMGEAKAWYRKAADQGYSLAKEALRTLESNYAGPTPATKPPPTNQFPRAVTKEQWAQVQSESQYRSVEQSCVFIYAQGASISSVGSGFFVAPGYVVTNAHVVDGAPDVWVTGKGMLRPTLANVVATDQSGKRDYALLQLNPNDCGRIEPLVFASVEPQRAEKVGAWGFPGLINEIDPNYYRFIEGDDSAVPAISYSAGVVNNLLELNPTVIMHDAQLSHGNSGGPLVNERGDVIGINTLIRRDEDSYRQTSIALSGRDLLQFLRNNGIPAQSR